MKNRILFVYYCVLAIILILWNNPGALPSLPMRITFLVLVVIPLFLSARGFFFVVFFFFVILSSSNHAVSYMPATGPSLVVCAFVGALFFKPSNTNLLRVPNGMWVLLFLTVIVDLILGGRLENLSYTLFLTVIVSLHFISSDREKQLEYIAYSFILLTLILSVEFFIWGGQFSETILIGEQEYERLGWSDPNYFSCILGFGALISYSELLETSVFRKKKKALLLITMLLAFYVMISIASRGATLALAISFILATMFSKISLRRRIVGVAGLIILLFVSMRLGYFDFLFSRVANDDGTAGNRVEIWSTKFHEYVNSDLMHILLGYGIKEGRLLGFSKARGFHNDYLAFLVSYGVVGFISFISMFISPLIHAGDSIRKVAPYLSYILIICLTLEPISSGNLIYFYFFIFILMIKDSFR